VGRAAGRIAPGYVAHTLDGRFQQTCTAVVDYGLSNNRVSIGLVLALEYADRSSIRTRRFKPGRRIRSQKIA